LAANIYEDFTGLASKLKPSPDPDPDPFKLLMPLKVRLVFLLTGTRPPFLQFGQNVCENALDFFLGIEIHKSGTLTSFNFIIIINFNFSV
jgi:hypothetical protein